MACELEVDPSGTVVNGGGRGETRASESLLGDALREGVADGRLEGVRAKLSDEPQTLCSEADILCIARGSASWTCSSTATLTLVLRPSASSPSRSGGGGSNHRRASQLEVASLHEEVPDTADLVHIELDELTGLAPTELPAATGVLAHERLLDDEVRLGHDAQRGAECLLFGSEEVQGGAVREVEGRS